MLKTADREIPKEVDERRKMIHRLAYLQHLLINAPLLALLGVSSWIIQMLVGCQGDGYGCFIFLISLLRIILTGNFCMKDEKLKGIEQRLKALEERSEGKGIERN